MSRTNPYGTHPTAHGASSVEKVAHVVDVKNDKDADGKPRFRVKIRVEGDQRDQSAIPDENLQWVRVEMPVNSMGSSPYMKPGMRVRVKDLGGSPGSTGISPYISSIVSYTPTNPENAQEKAVKRKEGVGPRKEQPPPNSDFPQKRVDWPTEATRTDETKHKDSFLPAQPKKADEAPHQAPNKNRHEENGTPSKAGGMLTDDDTMGTQKRQDNPDFQQQIKSQIKNQGAFVPTALDMIQNLKKVTGGQNPTAIQAVGAGALAQAMSAISKQFAKKKEEQVENKCAIENRPNLSPEDLALCIELDLLNGIAAREKSGEPTENLFPNTEPFYQTYDENAWDNQSANTIDSAAYQEAIANVSVVLMANSTFVSNVSTAVDTGVVANGIVANTTQSNTLANGIYTYVTTFVSGDAGTVNTLAVALQSNIAVLLRANTNFIANVLANSSANTYVPNGFSLSANVLILRNTATPANSTVGGQIAKSIFFDDNFIYCVLANGYIKRATLAVF